MSRVAPPQRRLDEWDGEQVKAPQINCIDGNTFMVSDLTGDVEPDPDQVLGLFYRDARHLSTWRLGFDGRGLDACPPMRAATRPRPFS